MCTLLQTKTAHNYGTAQFKLDRTYMQQGHDTIFISHTCKPACARKIGDVKPTMQSFHVRNAHVHVKNAHTKFRLRVYANCKQMTAE